MKLSFSLFLLCFLFSCTIENKKQQKTNKKIISGIKLYESRCTSCHGFDGKMGFGGAKDLTKSQLSLNEIINQVTNGKGAMAPYKNLLSKEEIDSVSSYVFCSIKQK